MVLTIMRLFVFACTLLAAALLRGEEAVEESPTRGTAALVAGTPPLLAEAIRKSALDGERWAYTQTVVNKDRTGKVKGETVERYDPSQPYEGQWTPLQLDGKTPTERQIKRLREEHAKRRKNRRSLGELLDLAKATVEEETAITVTYEVPLIKNGNQRLPPDKFRVTARVNKERQAIESVTVRLREPMRVGLILKLKSGEADLDFTSVDPQYVPPITALHADGEGSIFFVKVGGNYAATRTDFKRVTPYSERFKVKLGELKFLDY